MKAAHVGQWMLGMAKIVCVSDGVDGFARIAIVSKSGMWRGSG